MTPLSTSQSLLGRLLREESPGDWERFDHLYRPLLRSWLARQFLQPADVDDLVQDVLSVVVAKLSEFHHNGRSGAFRAWLRAILVGRTRELWRRRRNRPGDFGHGGLDEVLDQLEQAESDLARRWDEEHDRFILSQALELIRPEFTPKTWDAFRRYALDGTPPAEVAAELGLTTNAVCIARSRVMRRLREETRDLLDERPENS
jgi:RNA polymerase sigma-70 factor (ECF subfamily)